MTELSPFKVDQFPLMKIRQYLSVSPDAVRQYLSLLDTEVPSTDNRLQSKQCFTLKVVQTLEIKTNQAQIDNTPICGYQIEWQNDYGFIAIQ